MDEEFVEKMEKREKEKPKHTQGPWKRCAYHVAANGKTVVASCYPNAIQHNAVVRPESDDECVANADFIVRACNSYYDLIEALEETQRFIDQLLAGDQVVFPLAIRHQARAAIDKARTGEEHDPNYPKT